MNRASAMTDPYDVYSSSIPFGLTLVPFKSFPGEGLSTLIIITASNINMRPSVFCSTPKLSGICFRFCGLGIFRYIFLRNYNEELL